MIDYWCLMLGACSVQNKMELAMGVAVGSATQVSMFVVPVAVLSGWAMVRRDCRERRDWSKHGCTFMFFFSPPADNRRKLQALVAAIFSAHKSGVTLHGNSCSPSATCAAGDFMYIRLRGENNATVLCIGYTSLLVEYVKWRRYLGKEQTKRIGPGRHLVQTSNRSVSNSFERFQDRALFLPLDCTASFP